MLCGSDSKLAFLADVKLENSLFNNRGDWCACGQIADEEDRLKKDEDSTREELKRKRETEKEWEETRDTRVRTRPPQEPVRVTRACF